MKDAVCVGSIFGGRQRIATGANLSNVPWIALARIDPPSVFLFVFKRRCIEGLGF